MTPAALFTIAAVLNGNMGGPGWATIVLAVVAGAEFLLAAGRPRRPQAEVVGPLVPARREPVE